MTPPPSPPADRRLVILTADGPEHRYVTNRLCDALPIDAILLDTHQRKPSLRRIARRGVRHLVSKVLLQAYRKAIRDDDARHEAMEHVLGGDMTRRFKRKELVEEVDGVRSDACLKRMTALQPDAILVYGTTIVPDGVLEQASDVALNMHTGVSPWYRGTHCAFWPVVNGEPEQLGATVHECTSAVDGGRIFAVTRAAVEPDDQLHELFARAVQAGADSYVQVVRSYLAGNLAGKPQDLNRGREYRGYMRTFGAERTARRNLRRGLIRDYVRQTAETPEQNRTASAA